MQYAIQQRLMSFGDDFWIKDERGSKRYYVDGAAYSFGKKVTVKDTGGREVAFISQKLFSIRPTFRVYDNGKLVATLRKQLLSLRRRYVIDLPSGVALTAKGSFILHEYQISRSDSVIAKISKKIGRFTDCYGVTINDDENQVLLLSCAIILDLIEHSAKGGNS